jgi:succinate dehydrogenase / fumarate reductase membrane anchor subunit
MSKITGRFSWMMQRVSAILLVPLLFWFCCVFLPNLYVANGNLAEALSHGWSRLYGILWTLVIFYHGSLGIEVIFEDYVRLRSLRFSLCWVVHALSMLLAFWAAFLILQVKI